MEQAYQVLYTDSIYESAMATVSLHKTKQGAYNALRKFLTDKYREWYDQRLMYGKCRIKSIDKFEIHSAWAIRPIELRE